MVRSGTSASRAWPQDTDVWLGVPRILDGTFDPAQFDPRGEDTSSDARRVAEYLSSARININVRQVFPSGR